LIIEPVAPQNFCAVEVEVLGCGWDGCQAASQ